MRERPLAVDIPMQLEHQKIVGLILIFTPANFSMDVGEYSHEFLTTYHVTLHTLGLVKSREWCTLIQTRQVLYQQAWCDGFSKAFFTKYIPCSVMEHLRDHFYRLE